MPSEPIRRPASRRLRLTGALTLGAVALSGCARLGFDQGYETGRAGDTPYYSTASVPSAAETGAHTGVAAWDGDVSASGKTAAHAKLLPGSWARVTNTRTGGSSIVRVTRRLQGAPDRDIELSRDAAIDVGALHEGFATVLIEPIDPRQASALEKLGAQPASPPRPIETLPYAAPHAAAADTAAIETSSVPRRAAPAAAPLPSRRSVAVRSAPEKIAATAAGPRYLQLGSFRNPQFAQRARIDLQRQGMTNGAYGDAFIQTAYVNGAVFHRVRLGPIESSELASRALADARSFGHANAKLIKP